MEEFTDYSAARATLSPPYLSTDSIVVVRAGVAYKIDPTLLNNQNVFVQPTTGNTLTASAGQHGYILDPAGELATLAVVMPPAAADNQIFEVSSTQTIDALTATPAAGQSMAAGAGGPIVLAGTGLVAWRFRSANSTWYARF